MFPGEMVILTAVAETEESGKKLLTRPMDVISEYIGYAYDSLVKRGYLNGNSSRGYQLTSRGRDALFEFLHEDKTRAKDTINALRQLGIECSQEIDKLVKEAIEVK